MSPLSRSYFYFPVLLALVLILGIYLGTKLDFTAKPETGIILPFPQKRSNKLNEIINYVELEYVDSVSKEKLIDRTVRNLLEELDPHSYYISAEELQAMNEPLEGNFDGIGIEFSIQKDTIVVVNPIAGGPSEMLGIRAGDRIVKVEEKNVAGVKIANKDVMQKLRGKRGTKVNVSIFRSKQEGLLNFTITRDAIPIYSVDMANMLSSEIGYIKISRFSKTTFEEFLSAEDKLLEKGMKKLVLDLRGNGGGYLDAATKLADEFLASGQLIVYTQGRSRPREMYYATSQGKLTDINIAVLIDEGSASASEIIAGAIQDNDRGTVIGRRSFGKGLVQEQSNWPDGSAIRLTIARYYTPTGRCIQKPYAEGAKKYYEDFYESIGKEDSLALAGDSISKQDTSKYMTKKGKTLYGGGGIAPDVFIPYDTSLHSDFVAEVIYSGLFNQFAFEHVDKKRDSLKSLKTLDTFNKKFTIEEKLFLEFMSYAEKAKIKADHKKLSVPEKNQIKQRLKAYIARYIWSFEGYYAVMLENDKFIQQAMEILESANR